ncbi:MAG: hypothetical protein WCI27_05605 [Candidatus Omnitrophota bacterium]
MRQIMFTHIGSSGRRFVAAVVLFAFLVTNGVGLEGLAYAQSVFQLPKLGTQVNVSPSFAPALLKGVKVYPNDPFRLDFILDKGETLHTTSVQDESLLKNESSRLIKYFLASITVPEKDLWVNLSPYEKDRIVPDAFGQTEMGRDLLAQDYLLKQITASLMYPEGEVGKKFWARIYAEAAKRYGTTDIPVDTFNKVWITPDKAAVYETSNAAYVVESKLKVMLESDYKAAEQARVNGNVSATSARKDEALPRLNMSNDVPQQILREIIIPILEKEVNEGQNFAQLRQVYNSLILAIWFKDKIKASIFGQTYVDQDKIAGVNIDDKAAKDKIWSQYVESFKKGAYNLIREEKDIVSGEMIPRKYFSGGVRMELTDKAMNVTHDAGMISGLKSSILRMMILSVSLSSCAPESKSSVPVSVLAPPPVVLPMADDMPYHADKNPLYQFPSNFAVEMPLESKDPVKTQKIEKFLKEDLVKYFWQQKKLRTSTQEKVNFFNSKRLSKSSLKLLVSTEYKIKVLGDRMLNKALDVDPELYTYLKVLINTTNITFQFLFFHKEEFQKTLFDGEYLKATIALNNYLLPYNLFINTRMIADDFGYTVINPYKILKKFNTLIDGEKEPTYFLTGIGDVPVGDYYPAFSIRSLKASFILIEDHRLWADEVKKTIETNVGIDGNGIEEKMAVLKRSKIIQEIPVDGEGILKSLMMNSMKHEARHLADDRNFKEANTFFTEYRVVLTELIEGGSPYCVLFISSGVYLESDKIYYDAHSQAIEKLFKKLMEKIINNADTLKISDDDILELRSIHLEARRQADFYTLLKILTSIPKSKLIDYCKELLNVSAQDNDYQNSRSDFAEVIDEKSMDKISPKINTGGIDLTRDHMPVQVKADGQGVQFKFDPAMIQRLRDSSGMTPVIMDIRPMTTSVQDFMSL